METATATRQATIINVDGLILGRMASNVAKRLLAGEQIVLVNAEKAIISGRKKSKVNEARTFLEVGGVNRGPFHYRRPDRIVRKTVKGMLPTRQPKGKNAYKRLKVFMGVPDDLKVQKMESIDGIHARKLVCSYFTVGQLAKEIGWGQGE